GTKRFISSAGEAELYLVMARTGGDGPKGISAFAVEKGWPGFEFGKPEEKMGWHASPMRELIFVGCDVPADNLVGEEGQGYTIAASMAKLFASDMAMRVTTDAVQVHGGYGYMQEYPVERYMREAKALQIVEGTNQIQRMVIGRSLAGT